MATEKEDVILEFKVEQGEAIKELEQTKIAIINLKKEQQELTKAYKSGEKSTEEYAQELVRLEGELKKNNTAYNQNLKAAKGVETQFDKLIKTNKDLSAEVKKNTDTTKASIESLDIQGVSIESVGKKFAGTAGAIAAVTAILGGLAKAYTSSAAGARDLDSAQSQLGATTTFLGNKLAKLVGADGKGGGLLSALAFQLNRVLFGTGVAAQGLIIASANTALQELELVELEAQRAAKSLLDFSEVNRQIRDDTTASFEERKRAAENVGLFVDDRERALIEVQEKKLEQLNILLAQDQDNLEIKKAIRQVEFEIADIQEDSQGKRTEALTGINNLLREQSELIRQQSEQQSELDRARRLALVEEEFASEQQKADIKIELSNKSARVELENTSKILAARTAANKKEIDAKKQEQQIDALVTQSKLQNATTVLQAGSQLLKEGSAGAKAAAIAVTTAQTISAATAALAPPPVGVGPVFGPILAGITTALGLANVGKIAGLSFAAGGGSFLTNGPHLMVVGDNPGGRERVDVTPISGRGNTSVGDGIIRMAGGGSVVANASSSRIDQSFANANLFKDMNFSVSWREGNELGDKIRFKEELTTA